MPSRYTPRFRSVMKVSRMALLVGLSFLLSVLPVHAKNDKLTVVGTVVTVTGVITAVVGGNPRQKSDRERFDNYSSCYNNDGVNCYEQNYTDPGSGTAWDPNGKVVGIGLLLSAVGSFMIYKGMTGPTVVVAPQRNGASVTITHGW